MVSTTPETRFCDVCLGNVIIQKVGKCWELQNPGECWELSVHSCMQK